MNADNLQDYNLKPIRIRAFWTWHFTNALILKILSLLENFALLGLRRVELEIQQEF